METSQNVNLQFILLYDGQPLVSFDKYDYPLDYQIFFTKVSMYLSDLSLTANGVKTPLLDAVFLNPTASQVDEASASRGITVPVSNVPVGEYDGLSFNIGIPPDLNAKNPSEFPNDSPLSNSGEYWVGWSSYIFHKTEAKADIDGDGQFETNIALHIGSNDAFRPATLNKSISIHEGDGNTISLTLDLLDLYKLSNGYYDFQARPQIHKLEQLPDVLPLMDNLAVAIK